MLTASIMRVMMEAVSMSETSVNFYYTAKCNVPEDSHLQAFNIFPSIKRKCSAVLHVSLRSILIFISYAMTRIL
jgi:hypothetical protein